MTTPIPNIHLATCQRCRHRTPAAFLARVAKSFAITRQLCICCRLKANRSQEWFIFVATLCNLAIFPFVFLFPDFPKLLSELCVLAAAVSLCLVVTIPLHECAHALAAALVGYRVQSIEIGVGDPFATFKLRSITIMLSPNFKGGRCIARYPTGDAPRWKSAFMIAGGPAGNLLAALLALALYYMMLTHGPNTFMLRLLCFGFGIGQMSYALKNLIPGKLRVDHRPIPTDGSAILAAIRRRRASPAEIQSALAALKINDATAGGNLHAAREILNTARQQSPDDITLAIHDIQLSTWERRWYNVQAIARPLTHQPAPVGLAAASWLVIANLHTRTPTDLEEVAQACPLIEKTFKNDASANILRAFALCSDSNPLPALDLLSAAAFLPAYPLLRSILHLSLAQIHEHLACPEQALKHRALARHHDPHQIITDQTIPPLFPPIPDFPPSPQSPTPATAITIPIT